MKFHGLQAKEKKNALVYLVHFFLYSMNKLALLGLLNSLSDDDFMYCLADSNKYSFSEKSFTTDCPIYVDSCNSELGVTVTYPDGKEITFTYTTEQRSFFGYAPAGTKFTSITPLYGDYYKLIKIKDKN